MTAPASQQLPVARPVVGDDEVAAVRRVLLSGWVSQGPEVAAFEREFAAFVGAPHACAVSNCTTALHLALLAVGVAPGDEVITVSHSFIATANAVRYCGAEPVFVDVEPDGSNIDVDLVDAAITPRTKAILCVHQMGMPCDVRRLVALARSRGLAVVEDAACAIGSEILGADGWERIGRPHGDIACFSFHPRKVMTTGEGGMLTTANPEYDARFRQWRQHSMSVSDTVRHGSRDVVFESYDEVGYNYRMTDLQAAVGREQLKRLPGIVAARRRLADCYTRLLAGIPGTVAPQEPAWARSNWQSYSVILPEGCDQRETMQALLDRGISTRRGIMNAHLEAPYRAAHAATGRPLPHSEAAQSRRIILPLFPQMTEEDVEAVVEALSDVLCS